jgi:hypothetical protein
MAPFGRRQATDTNPFAVIAGAARNRRKQPMKKEDAIELAQQCLHDLSEALRDGPPETLMRYLDFMARFHRYSVGNLLMIMGQRPDAEYVAGFRAWKEMGRWVKPGEKGIAIIAPMVARTKDKEPEEKNREEKNPETRYLNGFRVVHVFDVKQTDGKDLPRLSELEGDPGEAHGLLLEVYQALGIAVVREELPAGTLGASRGGTVVLATQLNPMAECQILAHELSHELIHQGPEARKQNLSRQVIETEAEAVAYVVCKAHGFDALAVSNEYIRLHQGDAKTLEASFSRIRATASQILFLMSEAKEARRCTPESTVRGHDSTISAVWTHAA